MSSRKVTERLPFPPELTEMSNVDHAVNCSLVSPRTENENFYSDFILSLYLSPNILAGVRKSQTQTKLGRNGSLTWQLVDPKGEESVLIMSFVFILFTIRQTAFKNSCPKEREVTGLWQNSLLRFSCALPRFSHHNVNRREQRSWRTRP